MTAPNLQALSDALHRLETRPGDGAARQFATDLIDETSPHGELGSRLGAARSALAIITDPELAAYCARTQLSAYLPSPADAATSETDGVPTAPAAADAPTAPIIVEPPPQGRTLTCDIDGCQNVTACGNPRVVAWHCGQHGSATFLGAPDEKLQLSVSPCQHLQAKFAEGLAWCSECGARGSFSKMAGWTWELPTYARGIEQGHAQLDANRDRIAELEEMLKGTSYHQAQLNADRDRIAKLERELGVGRSFMRAALETIDKLRADAEKSWRHAIARRDRTAELTEHLHEAMVNS